MFFNPERIKNVRKMIISIDEKMRKTYIQKLLPYQKNDFYELFKTMSPYPVTVRLLDPPLHEFLPHEKDQIDQLSSELNTNKKVIIDKINKLKELNPMLGHRGCRLGITFPEITKMQAQAIFEATLKLNNENIQCTPEIMVP